MIMMVLCTSSTYKEDCVDDITSCFNPVELVPAMKYGPMIEYRMTSFYPMKLLCVAREHTQRFLHSIYI